MEREFKDSGLEWIGKIPKEWKTCRFKNFMELRREPSTSENKIGLENIESESGHFIETEGKFDGNGVQFRKGEIVYGKLRPYLRKVWLASFDGNAVGDFFVFRNNNNSNANYLKWLLLSDGFTEAVNSSVYGAKMPRVSSDFILTLPYCIPPLPEQQRIADYLDKKCGEIDELIALQEQMIKELKAYKQSAITEAVTKGLNPNVPMKYSGIDWMGEMPEHWKLEPLKYCFGRRSEKNNPVKTEERLSLSIGKGVTLYAEKTTNLDRFKDDFTQYQLAYPNDIVLNCMNMIVGAVGLSNYMGCVSPVYYVIYPIKQGINPLYYSYLLNIPTIRSVYYSLGKGIYAIERGEGRVNTCRLKVSYNDFGRLEIPVPPLEEQKEITQYIQQKNYEIDSLIALKQTKIEELKEYKKSIIYEYVTGKKEVT